MKIKMKEREVIIHAGNLNALNGLQLPVAVSYAISRNAETLAKEAGHIEEERKKLCEKYAEKGEDSKPILEKSIINGKESQSYRISGANMALFQKDYEALLDIDAEVEIRTVRMEQLSEAEQYDRYSALTVEQIRNIAFMIEE